MPKQKYEKPAFSPLMVSRGKLLWKQRSILLFRSADPTHHLIHDLSKKFNMVLILSLLVKTT